MDKPEPMFNDDQSGEEIWDNTDDAVADLLFEVSPVEMEDFDAFVKDMREYMLSQFESRQIVDRGTIHSYMEEDDADEDNFLIE